MADMKFSIFAIACHHSFRQVFKPHREKLLIFIKLDGTKFVSRWNSQIEKYNFRVCFDLI